VRSREYLTRAEVDRLITAAKVTGRYGARDATMIVLAYRHGLRVGELIRLRWDQVDFDTSHLHVNRLKGSVSGRHPLDGSELRALRQLQRAWPLGTHIFQSERRTPLHADQVRKIVTRAGRVAGLPFPVHPHMLRHSCGYALVNQGCDVRVIQDYLGHKNIQHTVTYTRLSDTRFEGIWD
jgi:type 1 fimbriae regulatory protein FimB/type 1 fimbriae regulatory protein FimE